MTMQKPNKTNWKKLNMGGKAPRCPLCHDWMVKKWEGVRGFFVFACAVDQVAIRVDDPFVGRWDEALHKSTGGGGMECPAAAARGCPGKARYFATSTGYMKVKCPKCAAEMSATEVEPEKTTGEFVAAPDAPGVIQ